MISKTTCRRSTVDELRTGGTVLPITRWGTPVMHARTRPVVRFDRELHELVRNMFATMYAAEGVGLAATQVGVDLAVFVFDCPDDDQVRHVGVICNPEVTLPEGKDRHLETADEGCLSLPGAYLELARPDHAVCTGEDHEGRPVEVHGTGLLARCLQHETDHLNGTVFGDRLSGRARKKLYSPARGAGGRLPRRLAGEPRGWRGRSRRSPRPPRRSASRCRPSSGSGPGPSRPRLHRADRPAPSVPSMIATGWSGRSVAATWSRSTASGRQGQGHGGEARVGQLAGRAGPVRRAGPRAGRTPRPC